MLLLLTAHLAYADCAAKSSDLLLTMEDAEAAFGRLDVEAFRAATDKANADVRCLVEVVSRPMVARLHRLEGLRWWADNDAERARASFAAARAIEPDYRFPDTMVPAGHPVLEQYALSEPRVGEDLAVAAPASGALWFDGREGQGRPSERATLAQLVAVKGDVRASALLWPGEPLFPYDTAKVERKGPNLPLTVAAGACVVASGVLFALAQADWDTFHDPATRAEDLPGLQNSTNALYFSSVGAGVAALGTGAAAVVTGHW